MIFSRPILRLVPLACLVAYGTLLNAAAAQTTLKNICRIKGQEENTLQGLGIVTGLKGTGDGGNFLPTVRTLAKAMTVMGTPLSKSGLADLKDAKNVALVAVTATVPAGGARQGDKLECVVSSIGSAKSLAGGRLFLTPLMGPDRASPRIYAFAEGPITLDSATITTSGRVFKGCRLEEDFFNVFTKDGKITLVLDRNHADFQVAQDVAELINSQMSLQSAAVPLAKALNQVNVEVLIPPQYRDDPVQFVSQVLNQPILQPDPGARVVVNERSGSIVISGNVEIGPVVVTHKNVVIETGNAATPGARFIPLDPGGTSTARLKALVEALSAVHVPNEDVIDIIKGLDRNGKLHAQLIIE
jgi:flagellar P-ring protein precursor FlgI